MKQFLKDNLAIVAAIALPLILVILFALSTLVVNRVVADPQYDFLIATNFYGGSNEAFYFDVVQNRLKISYAFPTKVNGTTYQNGNISRLWRVRVPAMTVEEIALVPPSRGKEGDETQRVSIEIPGVSDLHVISAQPAPDGYTFEQTYNYYNSNLMRNCSDREIAATTSARSSRMAAPCRSGTSTAPPTVPTTHISSAGSRRTDDRNVFLRKGSGDRQILQIIEANHLDAADIRKVARAARKDASQGGPGRRVALSQIVLRVFYYLGGTLVFAGLGIYIETAWHDLTSVQRVLVTLGPGFVAYLLGIIFARNPDLEKAATPAHILAFVLQPVGGFVLLKEFFHGNDTALGAMLVFGTLAVQQLLTFVALKRPSLLLFSLLFIYGFAGAATVHFDLDFGIAALACGLFLYFISVDLQRKGAYRDLTPLFFTLGSALMLAGVSYHVGRTIYEPLTLALCLGFLMHAVLSDSKMLYVMSLVYIAGYFWGGPAAGGGDGAPTSAITMNSPPCLPAPASC